jgi:hypothetical protein
MDRPGRFEDHRWVGDKRTQIAHDIDACTAPEIIEELMQAETYLCFAPDALPEARNRGYRRCGRCDGVMAAAELERAAVEAE